MLDVLLPDRYCLWCGGDISHRKKSAKHCNDSHKLQRWERLNPGSRAIRTSVPLHNGKKRSRRPACERPKTRYAVVKVAGSIIEVLAFDSAKSKRSVEQAFGISARPDLVAIAERHLPALAGASL